MKLHHDIVFALLIFLLASCGRFDGRNRKLETGENGGPPICTLLGCLDGMGVGIVSAAKKIPNGIYHVWVEINETELQVCKLTIQGKQASRQGNCDGIEATAFYGDGFVTSMGWRTNRTDIDRLRVAVAVNGLVVDVEDVRPEYRKSFPNGEECGGACTVADGPTLSIDAE